MCTIRPWVASTSRDSIERLALRGLRSSRCVPTVDPGSGGEVPCSTPVVSHLDCHALDERCAQPSQQHL